MGTTQAWLRYCLPFWPGLPHVGKMWDADCAIVLAFGRNHYHDGNLHLVRAIRDLKGDDRQAIGHFRAMGFDPGDSNRGLARAMELICWDLGCGLIPQWEVAVAFDESYRLWGDRVRTLWPPDRGYYDTDRVLCDALSVMKREGWKTPLLIAHDWQMPRAFLQLKKLLGRPPIVMPVTDSNGDKITSRFDLHSVQLWTRHPLLWLAREIPGRVALLAKGYV